MLSTSSDQALAERTRRFGVAHRADGDYQATIFRCPKHPDQRQYQSVRPPVPHAELSAVSAYCYWCDAYGHLRGDPRFDRDRPQVHVYPLIGGDEEGP